MVTGGRVLVRAVQDTAGGQVDAAEVLAFAESVRGDTGTLKGIDIAAAGFTDEAYAALGATPALVELIDAPRLLDLVRQLCPRASRAARALPIVQHRGPPSQPRGVVVRGGATRLSCFLTDEEPKGVCIMATFIKDKAVIVVGVDYSQNSNDALEAACDIAGTRADAALHLVHVLESQRHAALRRHDPLVGALRLTPAPTDELQTEQQGDRGADPTDGPCRRERRVYASSDICERETQRERSSSSLPTCPRI